MLDIIRLFFPKAGTPKNLSFSLGYAAQSGKASGLLVVLAILGVATGAVAAVPGANYVEGEALVRFRASEAKASVVSTALRHGAELTRHFGELSAHEGRVIGLIHSPTLSTKALLVELRADPTVEFAEPNYLRHFSVMRPPNDPKFAQLWALKNTGQKINGSVGTTNVDIGFLTAWGMARPTTNEIVVGVIDSGMDITHPDLVGCLWTNPGEVSSNNIDDDGNGYVDDVHGYDFVLRTGSLSDSWLHGTHVSGTIAASANNGIGVTGVDYKAHIMVLKASDNATEVSDSAIIEAIQYATMMKKRGVNVVALNGSFGGSDYSDIARSAIVAAGDVGIIFCVAAGNDAVNNDNTLTYPASYRLPNMIVVAATDENDDLASFSDYGAATVDLAAPGVDILSCLPVNQVDAQSYVLQSTNTIPANSMDFSGLTSEDGISGTIYYCGLGNPADFPSDVKNNIALIQRGSLFFSEKVANAMTAGARAVILYNNVSGGFSGTLGAEGDPAWIPAVCLSLEEGQALQAIAPTPGTVVSIQDYPSYKFLSGTSMATPHVSGAVAFAARNFPNETVTQRISRILNNTTPVSALAGLTVTGGRLNLARMVDTDGNGLPDWWELQYFGQLTGTSPTADPDHDGQNNLAEFLAGTDPTDSNSVLRLAVQPLSSAPQFALQWPSFENRYYTLIRSTNLLSGFAIVETNILATPPLNNFIVAPSADNPKAFYRLELEP